MLFAILDASKPVAAPHVPLVLQVPSTNVQSAEIAATRSHAWFMG